MISGKQGSGKSTLQKAIIEKLISRSKAKVIFNLKFADVLYRMHDAVLKILYSYLPKRKIQKDGPLLQVLGIEWGRNTLGENIWVDLLKERIKQHQVSFNPDYIFIDECRFENEFNAFPEALRIRLECPKEIRKARCSMWRDNDSHHSEIGLDDYAKAHKFDLYLDTTTPLDDSIDLVLKTLELNGWHHERGR